MPENSPYFMGITDERALLLTQEEQLEGNTTISFETQSDLTDEDLLTCIQENFSDFLRLLRYLTREDQELLLSYYLLSKTQNTLALIHKFTQTVCSSYIRMAVKKIGAFILLGEPSAEVIENILKKANLEDSLKGVSLSKAIALYDKTRSFQYVANTFKIHRPDIRRAMSRASKHLVESKDDREQVLGAYIHGLIDKASASGQGFSKRKMAKQCHIYRVDPKYLGEFRINLKDPNIDQLFVSRANR
jgi:hypothetical protein